MPVNRSATMPVEPPYSDANPQYDMDELVDSYYGLAPDDPEMPNFDAMPDAKGGGVDERGWR